MRRKIVLTVLFCLATALAIGAAPALAASGCTCHTAVPPTGGAPAAHAPLVVGVDCTTCHTDWTVPHPDAEQRWPFLRLRTSATGLELPGGVRAVKLVGAVGHPDVGVYLQQRPWGATEFTDLARVTTDGGGNYTYAVASPARFAAYRAIAEGHVGPLVGGGTALFEPQLAGPTLMRPKLTLKLQGVKNGIVKLGNSVTATGTVEPADIGVKAIIRVQKRVAAKSAAWPWGWWVTRMIVYRALSATGTFSYRFTPRELGWFRVSFRTRTTAGWDIVRSPAEHKFRVE